ncbi:MAG: zf-HC2 domain-containing protein, partial [Acidobacteria bacterium]|nr:zf-HC2 domain-containing protein [Acidobacteriota bacterium]
MFSKRHKSLLYQTWHPSENELLVYLDGEMDAKSSQRVEAHLKGCWSCRVKREETERLISAFMKSRASALGESSSSPAGALPRLQSRLDQLDSELGAPTLFAQWIVALRRTREWSLLSVRRLTVVTASALLIVILLRMTSSPTVSAREILERTKQAETQRLQKVAGPVVYRKLQLRRGSSAPRSPQVMSWEIWNDVTHSRFRQRVEDENGQRFIAGEIDSEHAIQSSSESASAPPVLIELQQILRANRMDVRHPLSAGVYETWRRTLHQKTEEVIEKELPDGRSALTLITAPAGPFANN